MAPLATARLRTALLAFASTAALVVSLFPSAALAAPTPTATDVEAQIEAKGRALDAVVEQYNGLVLRLSATTAQAIGAATRYATARQTAATAAATVAALATRAYEGGALANLGSLISAGSPENFLDRLTSLDALARSEHASAATLRESSATARAEKARLDQLVASQAQQATTLAARKVKIQADIDALIRERDAMRAAARAAVAAAKAAPKPASPVSSAPPVPVFGRAGVAVGYARRQLGKPYVWATAGPNTFDCSGLTMAAWAAAGVRLDHYTYAQIKQTTRISRGQLSPGDLVFFYGGGHVGIYIGNNQVIHAPHPGDVVKISDIDWMGGYYTAGRPH